jgi:BED zinc finger
MADADAGDGDNSTEAERRAWKVVAPRGCSSEWWQYFSVYTFATWLGVAVCNLCRAEVPRGNASSTTPLRQHIEGYHPEYYADGILRKLEKKPGAMHRFTVTNPAFLESSIKWLVMTQQPLSVAESPHFKSVLASLSSKVAVPSRRVITEKLIGFEQQVFRASLLQYRIDSD